MVPGDTVTMTHPDGYATITGGGGDFVGWIPNGVHGVVYLLTPDSNRAVVHFEGKLFATVAKEHLIVGAVAEATHSARVGA